jgi:hypothetical protein
MLEVAMTLFKSRVVIVQVAVLAMTWVVSAAHAGVTPP